MGAGMSEYEYDFTRWKDAKVWSGGSTDDWENFPNLDKDDPKRIKVHPREMQDYKGLIDMWQRDLFVKSCSIDGDLYLDVIKLQEDLKFHFYYTGIDPEDGTDDPKTWMCLIIYDRKNLPGIVKGLKQIGLDIAAQPEDPVAKDTDDLAIQMMLRSSEAWVTFCDPWMKKIFSDPQGKLQPGRVYHYDDETVKSLGL